jgi:exopolysaccharide biosynthesis polyprenyl glycosylphosphotransferase
VLVSSLPLNHLKPAIPSADPQPDVGPGTAPDASPSKEAIRSAIATRLRLQQSAAATVGRHLRRAVLRLAVLVSADLVSFALMRELVRAVRDYAVLGAGVAQAAERVSPAGILRGWQYAAALLVGLAVTGSYGQGDRRRDPGRLFLAAALATALPLWMTLWTRGVAPVLLQYAVTTLLVWAGVVVDRLAVDRVAERVRPAERDRLDTLFVGSGAECLSAMRGPIFTAGVEYRPVGFVDSAPVATPGALGSIADFPLLLAASGAHVVVVCGYLANAQFREVVEAALAAGCQVLSVPRSVEVAGVHPTTVWRRGHALVELTAPSLRGWQLALKRVVDVCGAAVGLVVLSPVFGVLAALVKLDSPGPAFFTQERVGLAGRRFRIVKFRTMVDGADGQRDGLLARSVYRDARLFKMPADPRTTKLGRWLRRTSLDELPQLVNVLKGEMSLVGPRPPMVSEVALYEAHHYARFDVKPGMTGPWQVAGRNEVRDFERVVALETAYVRDWSLATDVGILLRTMPAVMRGRGAH